MQKVSKTKALEIEPYFEIVSNGCDVELTRADYGYIVQLKKGKYALFKTTVPRTGRLTMAEVREKMVGGKWGRTSAMYSALEAMAEISRAIATKTEVAA